MKPLALLSSPPDPHSFSPCTLGAAAPLKIQPERVQKIWPAPPRKEIIALAEALGQKA